MRDGKGAAGVAHLRRALCLDVGYKDARDALVLLSRKGLLAPEEVGPARECASGPPAPTPTPPPPPSPPPRGDPDDLLAGVVVRPDPRRADLAWEAYGYAREKGDAISDRIDLLRDAAGHGHDPVEVDLALGREALEDERIPAARFHLQRAWDAGGPDAVVALHMARALSLAGDDALEDQVAWLRRALQVDPGSGEAHFLLAVAYDRAGNSPAVLRHAQRAIQADPDNKERFKGMLRDSATAAAVQDVAIDVIRDSEAGLLTDELVEEYVEKIVAIVGEESLGPGALGPDGRVTEEGRERVRGLVEERLSPRQREEAVDALRRRDAGGLLRLGTRLRGAAR